MKRYDVDPKKLSQVFDNTTSTYKFYWFLALLDTIKAGRASEDITFTEMVARMVGKAWRPLVYNVFTFGNSDALVKRIETLKIATELKNSDVEQRIVSYIMNHPDEKPVKDVVEKLTVYVPYRFLYPWVGSGTNSYTKSLSEDFKSHRCPYAIINKTIRINPAWTEYLLDHYDILCGFIKYRLLQYLIRYNDNVTLPEESVLKATAEGFAIPQCDEMGIVAESNPEWKSYFDQTNDMIRTLLAVVTKDQDDGEVSKPKKSGKSGLSTRPVYLLMRKDIDREKVYNQMKDSLPEIPKAKNAIKYIEELQAFESGNYPTWEDLTNEGFIKIARSTWNTNSKHWRT